MKKIQNYIIEDIIYESDKSQIYRVHNQEDLNNSVIKVFKKYPGMDAPGAFLREYKFLKRLNIPGIIQPKAIIKEKNISAIVFEDINGQALSDLIKINRLKLDEKIKIGIKVCDILFQLHKHNALHKNLNPENIILNPETGEMRLVGFESASFLADIKAGIRPVSYFSENLLYISPELTGRLNRGIDFRSDYYSLGITLYELFSGLHPFPQDSPLKMIHAHLAKEAPPLSDISHANGRDTIPKGLSDIIAKLMNKMPEDRYQSLFVLRIDLNRILESLENMDELDKVVLSENDIPDRLVFSEKNYGRLDESELLLNSFENICAGKSEFVVIKGEPGIGKSTLVKEIYRPMLENYAYFVSGRFEPHKIGSPYSGLFMAISDLIDKALSEGAKRAAFWKEKILNMVGENCDIINAVLPDAEKLTGIQKSPPEISFAETSNRFYYAIKNFIKVFASKEHPLVIFLEDIQWASKAAMELIHKLISDIDINRVLIIASCSELDESKHSELFDFCTKISKNDSIYNEIFLEKLNEREICNLIMDTFRSSESSSLELSKYLHSYSRGNPFYTKELLSYLFNMGNIKISEKNGRFKWRWDIQGFSKNPPPAPPREILKNKIGSLPDKTIKVLKQACRLGHKFSLNFLAIINNEKPKEIAKCLHKALEEKIIARSGFYYNNLTGKEKQSGEYIFLHNIIWHTIDSIISENERKELDYQIFRSLREHYSDYILETKLFDIAIMMNNSIELIEGQKERLLHARVNLKAGKQARMSADFDLAHYFFKMGLNSLSGADKNKSRFARSQWDANYNLILKLHIEAAESASILGYYPEMEEIIAVVFERAINIFDKVKAYHIQISSHIMRKDFDNAIEYSLLILKQLGVRLTNDAGLVENDKLLSEIIELKNKFDADALPTMKEMDDPYKLSIMKILALLSFPAYDSSAPIYPFTIREMLKLSAEYGIAPQTSFAFALAGRYLSEKGKFELAYSYGQMALALQDKAKFNDRRVMTRAIVYIFTNPVVEHIRHSADKLITNFNIGMSEGNLVCSSISAFESIAFSCLNGDSIEKVQNEIVHILRSFGESISLGYINVFEFFRMFCLTLSNPSYNLLSLENAYLNTEDSDTLIREKDNLLFIYFLLKAYANLILGDYAVAKEILEKAKENYNSKAPVFYLGKYYYYYLITAIYNSKKASDLKNEDYEQALKGLSRLASLSPDNFEHNLLHVKAEFERLSGNYWEAVILLDKSIDLSISKEYGNDSAFLCERAAEFLKENNAGGLTKYYINKAYSYYSKWGAGKKVLKLLQTFPGYIEKTAEIKPNKEEPGREIIIKAPADNRENLDIMSLLKAYQAITKEIALDKLLEKLIKVVVENAGADRAVIVIESSDSYYFKSEYDVRLDQFKMNKLVSIDDDMNDSLGLIKHSLETKEDIIINDSENLGKYNKYFSDKIQAKSIIVIAALFFDKVVGAIYLENNLSSNAFSQDRIEVLKLLASQIANSVEHAMLYQRNEEYRKHLEFLVKNRTAELETANRNLQDEILEKEKIEEALRNSEELYRSILESIGDSIHLVDRDLRIIYANNALYEWCRSLGINEELTGRFIYDVFPIKKDVSISLYNIAFESGKVSVSDDVSEFKGKKIITEVRRIPVYKNDEAVKALTVIRDITKKRESEISLARNEKLYRDLVDTMLEGVVILNSEGEIRVTNTRLTDMLEIPQEDLIGKNISELPKTHGRDNILTHFIRRKIGDNEPYSIKIDLNGKIKYMTVTPKPLYDDEHLFAGSIALFTDVTNFKTIEFALRENEEKFRFVLDNSLDALYQLNMETRTFDYISPSVERILGLNPEEAIEKGIDGLSKYIHPEDLLLWLNSFGPDSEETKKFGEKIIMEYRYINKAGDFKYLNDSHISVLSEDGNQKYIIGTIRDITKNKTAEEKLKLSEATVRGLLNAPSDIITLIDRDGIIWELNETAIRYYDLPKNKLIGSCLFDHFDKDIVTEMKKTIHDSFNNREEYLDEKHYQNKWFELGLYPILNENGESNKLAIFAKDVSERKKSEETIIESEKQLKKLNATKDKLFSIIAHDLKNPLGAFLSMSNVLSSDFDDFSNNDIKDFIDNVHKSSKNLVGMIENLMFWSRSQAGIMEFTPIQFQMKIIIDDIVSYFLSSASKKKVNLYSEANENYFAFADPKMITFILKNLIDNAIKFSEAGGEIVVSVKDYREYIEVEVSDNGVGIKKEDLSKLFKIDQKFTRKGTNNEEGAGLGLILCKEFVEKNNGDIWAQSKLGQGSVFVFSLPKADSLQD